MEPETEKLANFLTGFFLAKQAEGCSPNTIAEYQKDFAYFARWCQARGMTDPAAMRTGTGITSGSEKGLLAARTRTHFAVACLARRQKGAHGRTLWAKPRARIMLE